jgi:hypothetical protein
VGQHTDTSVLHTGSSSSHMVCCHACVVSCGQPIAAQSHRVDLSAADQGVPIP